MCKNTLPQANENKTKAYIEKNLMMSRNILPSEICNGPNRELTENMYISFNALKYTSRMQKLTRQKNTVWKMASNWVSKYQPQNIRSGEQRLGNQLRIEHIPFLSWHKCHCGIFAYFHLFVQKCVQSKHDNHHISAIFHQLHDIPHAISNMFLDSDPTNLEDLFFYVTWTEKDIKIRITNSDLKKKLRFRCGHFNSHVPIT